MVGMLTVKSDGTEGMVIYNDSDGQLCPSSETTIRILENGEICFRCVAPPTFESIALLLLFPRTTLKINLDDSTQSHLYRDCLATLMVNKVLHNYELSFWQDNYFKLEMTSFTRRTSFCCFSMFRQWFCGQESCESHPNALSGRPAKMKHLQLDLCFDLRETVSLDELRISIIQFILATSYVDGDTFKCSDAAARRSESATHEPQSSIASVFPISVILSSLEPHSCGTSSHFDLSSLRINLAVFLAKLVDTYPRIRYKTCPDILIDGHGDIAEYRFKGESKFHSATGVRGRVGKDYTFNPRRYLPYPYTGTLWIDAFNGSTDAILTYLCETIYRPDQKAAQQAAERCQLAMHSFVPYSSTLINPDFSTEPQPAAWTCSINAAYNIGWSLLNDEGDYPSSDEHITRPTGLRL
ncbi:hypothetical protein EJ04DRAFT_521354 [Polyplosphaeria fusca]|uniref:Uncharacterized protein n=1 Tax=Polyplosphaeria fusca TaxID=682080 RepID=A0A9P4V683_9PLEO|nr:hypothetical protein EJ04DRAFT_521354 [Polyplosphaeria fusca]